MPLNFYVMEFVEEDGVKQAAVIPENWVVDDETAYWPPFRGAKMQRAVTQGAVPEESWETYPCKILKVTDSFEKARRKMRKWERYLDLDTTTCEEGKTSHRPKRKLPQIQSSGSEGDASAGDSDVPDGSPVKTKRAKTLSSTPKHRQSSGKRGSTMNSGTLPKETHSAGVSGESLAMPQVYSNLSASPSVSLSNSVMDFARVASMPASAPMQTLRQTPPPWVERQFLLLEKILSKQEEMDKKLNYLMKKMGPAADMPPPLPEDVEALLPLRNIQDLRTLEEKLTVPDTMKAMVQSVAVVGGSTPKEVVYNILRKIVGQQLAEQMCWTGTGDKQAFNSLLLSNVLKNAVRSNQISKDTTDHEIQKAGQSWFRTAPDRNGGRKRRMLAKLQQQQQLPADHEHA